MPSDPAEGPRLVDVWFRAHADQVLAYLLHRTDPETAQDVLQEVFVAACRRWSELPDPPVGWLFGTARRLLANTRRGSRRRDNLIARMIARGAAGDALAAHTEPGELADLLAGLSATDREVLTLSSWYDLSPADAAAALGCSASTYAVRLHRARRRLAARLGDVAPGALPTVAVDVS